MISVDQEFRTGSLRWFCLLTEKKMHNLKVENYGFLFDGISEDLSLGSSFSDSSEGLLGRDEGGAGIYRSFCNKKQVVRTSKDYC